MRGELCIELSPSSYSAVVPPKYTTDCIYNQNKYLIKNPVFNQSLNSR